MSWHRPGVTGKVMAEQPLARQWGRGDTRPTNAEPLGCWHKSHLLTGVTTWKTNSRSSENWPRTWFNRLHDEATARHCRTIVLCQKKGKKTKNTKKIPLVHDRRPWSTTKIRAKKCHLTWNQEDAPDRDWAARRDSIQWVGWEAVLGRGRVVGLGENLSWWRRTAG